MAQKLIMEKRTEDGKLDLSQPQPPFSICTEDQIAKYYFLHSGDTAPSARREDIAAWYKAQGFTWRPKTW